MEITFKNTIKVEYFIEVDGDEFQTNDLSAALRYIKNTHNDSVDKELEELANFIKKVDSEFKAYRLTALITLDNEKNETIHLRKSL